MSRLRSTGARFRANFRARLLGAGVMLVLGSGALASGILILSLRGVFLQQLEWRTTSIAQATASRAQFPLLVGDWMQLGQLAQEALADQDVLFVVITGASGQTTRVARPGFAAADLAGMPPGTAWEAGKSEGRLGALPYLEVRERVAAPSSSDLLDLEAPRSEAPTGGAGSGAIGIVRVGVSLERSKSTVVSAILRAIAGVLLAMAVILWIEWRRLGRLLAPLHRLTDFTSQVGRGNLEQRATVEGVDEISSVAAAFNRMLDRLAATLVSKDLAEQANLAKSRFLATTGHELRTPLNAIIGYSEMLEEECQDRGLNELLPDLGRIHHSGRILLDLINDLLDYSKAEAGKTQLSIEEVAVAGVLEEVAAMVEPMARKNKNTIVVEPAGGLRIRADYGRFRQSLLNLASNACKFTDSGVIRIGARAGERTPGECEIYVRDTGIGIPAAEIGKLFEAFVQVDSSHTRKFGGTGLGLAISRKFCRMMGGDIRVVSTPGAGSVFTICLPVAQIPNQEAAGLSEKVEEKMRIPQPAIPQASLKQPAMEEELA